MAADDEHHAEVMMKKGNFSLAIISR